MKRLLLLTLTIVLVNGVVLAQPDLGSIDVFSDPEYTSCNFSDTGALIQIFVLATNSNAGATASQFKLNVPGTAWTPLGHQSPFQAVIGDPINGISIGYGQCLTGSFLILSVNFFGDGSSPPCSFITVAPDPATSTGGVEIVDCQLPFPEKWSFPRLGQGIVNGDASCDCTYVPIQDTTWGGIKALYN